MHIIFISKKLEKICNSMKEMEKNWGTENARKIGKRFGELAAAPNLSEISNFPPVRCHELTQNRSGQFAVDGKHPFRLIFEPNHDPIPRKEDGGIDRTKVTSICIIEVVNYHEK